MTIKENEELKEKYKSALDYLKKADKQKKFLEKKEKKLQLIQENLLLSKQDNENEKENLNITINKNNFLRKFL